MNYLEIVNAVIRESGSELNELNPTTWTTAAGQRMYPRIKNYVRQAWKTIQMDRDQWEFNNAQHTELVFPRLKFTLGTGAALPQVGEQFRGMDSGFTLVVRRVILTSGDWVTSPATGQIEFEYLDGRTNVTYGEMFLNLDEDSGFMYNERGSYDFGLDKQDLAEIRWDTVVGYQAGNTSHPMVSIPWENWFYQSYAYNTGTRSAPTYVSQDFEGNMVFYPQTLDPFTINFVYTATPQELSEWDDIPARIPTQFHEWIAWEALMLLATYDKNQYLMAHAERNARPFRIRAEKNLMPQVTWRSSKYNE